MKTYQPIEPTIQAGIITTVTYTLDDGSTHQLASDPLNGSYYVVSAGKPDGIVPAATFTSEYVAVPQS